MVSKEPKNVEIVFPKDKAEPNSPIILPSNPFGHERKAKSNIGLEHIDFIVTYRDMDNITINLDFKLNDISVINKILAKYNFIKNYKACRFSVGILCLILPIDLL